ncbi:hypothetical protein PV10_01223 [Exophiala mesophila]|uniref:Glycosylphosphatidylinositol anchor biosynthesis protein 11 n=1 Tax=Exophiala mesophila TaxID=212818 RepID=A0A0D1ZSG5_EXOME|nr:uncharacterized protein PV10_01223 [Exophiala mesophila]KIV97472.1 hypothetical protein PV10_01223 [Exophiala mesophila]
MALSPSSGSLTHLDLPSSQSPSSSGPPSARLLNPSTNAIPLLTSPLAKRYNHVHTALVPTYFYLRAGSLVADPLPTLIQDLTFVALAQTAAVAISLPSAGNWLSGTNAGRIIEGTASYGNYRSSKSGNTASAASLRKKGTNTSSHKSSDHGNNGGSWRGRAMPTLFSLILTMTLPPIPLTVVALVLGAPLYPSSLLPHTLALAAHVSLLGFLPLFYSHGVSALAWRDITAAWLPFDEAGVWGGTVGVMVGGWIGAIPIALDWDREWQKWPCTVLWGCVLGWTIGRVLTSVLGLGVGKRINLSEKEQPSPGGAGTSLSVVAGTRSGTDAELLMTTPAASPSPAPGTLAKSSKSRTKTKTT